MGKAYGFMILEAMNQGQGACIVGELDNELVTVNDGDIMNKQYFGLDESQIITAAIIRSIVKKHRSVRENEAYCNEAGVGTAIKKSGVPREQLFITTKVWNSNQGYESTLRAFVLFSPL